MKNLLPFIALSFFITSCISFKTFSEIEDRYANLRISHKVIEIQNSFFKEKIDSLKMDLKIKNKRLDSVFKSLIKTKNNLSKLKIDYQSLLSKSDIDIKARIKQNNALLDSLNIKQRELNIGLTRVKELERILKEKETKLKLLKKSLSDALLNFKGNGLTVEEKNGKVYVSMENKLLFNSGSWTIGKEGKKAIKQLSSVLAKNPEINILIEGHTDNVQYSGDGLIKDNWDLSTKRATAIVKLLLSNKNIVPQNLTAAGKGEFFPIASNNNEKGRASNRRIEVILTPQLDAITELINNIN